MSFLNFALLGGLSAVAIPILLHLLNKRTPKVLEWGAMLFLMESVESRKRRIQLEEALLLAARCLLAGLLALAVARPFVPAGSPVPWVVVLPAFLLAVVSFTTAMVLRSSRKWFWILISLAAVLGAGSMASVVFERMWNLKRFANAGGRDIALIIDGSDSMRLRAPGGGTVFETALTEARAIVDKAPPGSAFSLILAGPVPVEKIGEPVVNRLEMVTALKDLQPTGGPMAAFDSLAAAALSLARGSNAAKEIIILTDGQDKGWEIDNKSRWQSLIAGLDTLPARPEVILRKFALPATNRNAAIAGVRFSREIIGTDRPVSIEVTIENTGTEAITPGSLDLKIGDEVLRGPTPGQLPPGATQSVRFSWQFRKSGSVLLRAVIGVEDDLPADNSTVSVCTVTDRLGVLLIDGNPSGPFMEHAASFAALALAPVSVVTAAPSPDSPEGEHTEPMLDPEVIALSRVGSVESFAKYAAVILADVPRLPESSARRLATWVQGGGGLLVLPGAHALPDFYNQWSDAAGLPLLPARLRSEFVSTKDSVGVSLPTFTHPAVAMVADGKHSDLGGTLFTRYWKLELSGAGGSFTGASLGNRDPFLTARRAGLGTVLMTCANFDASGSNLPSRQAFVPLVHQLVYHLARPDGQPLNRTPARELTIPLAAAANDGGLRGGYFKGRQLENPVLVRIDGRPDFNWGNGSPGPGVPQDFSARWTGSVTPKYSGEYTFDGWGDDELSVWVGGKRMFDRGGEGQIQLEAGRSYPIRLEFTDRSGGAALQLFWRSDRQRREVVPSDALTPVSSEAGQSESVVGRWEVSAPDGGRTHADLVFTQAGLMARLSGGLMPGLYRMAVPPENAPSCSGLLAADGSLPFSVAGDVSESRLSPLSPPQLTWLHQQWNMVETGSLEDVLAALSGKKFGEELWKYLAAAALFLLLAETALSRWIALSRRSGEEESVDFENRGGPSAGFQEQLRKVRETAGA